MVTPQCAQGRVSRDARAQQGRGSGQVEVGGNAKNEVLVDHDAVGVAAVRHASHVLVREVVSKGKVVTKLLEPSLALGTGAIGVHDAAHGSKVAGLELGHARTDLSHPPDDFMAGNARINGRHQSAPLIAGLVEVGVADAAEENLDLHVVFGGIAARDRCR